MASSSERDIVAWLDTIGAGTAETIQRDPHSTITPSLNRDTAAEQALAALRGLRGGDSQQAALEIEQTLGAGGMGVVRMAKQVALGRTVAVKTLRTDRRDDGATLALLREAWVTGSLEHPNVVPVHDVKLEENGDPVIVLKRIEGVAWSELMGDAERVGERFGTDDLLAWNLGIFLQVVNAIRFAHSRGIIHRDIKPDNVMIGEFGEVYVLDWGIAVSLRHDASGRLPLAEDARETAGTPCYMAPEMLSPGTTPLSERTDVYLLGAVLYEIIAGRPPHLGETAAEVVSSVMRSEASLPADAPSSLQRICRRAMHADPGERYRRAEELQQEVQRFLQHRGSMRLARQSQHRLDDLLAHLSGSREGDTAWRQRLYKLFGGCRFGFREALGAWSDNQLAREGLRRATIAVAEYELEAGDARAAEALVAELGDVPQALGDRIAQALKDRESERARIARLEKLDADMDRFTGSRTRTGFAVIASLGPTILPLWAGLCGYRVAEFEHSLMALITGTFALAFGGLVFWARESMMKTAINRSVVAGFALMLLSQLVLQLATYMLGIGPAITLVLHIFIWFIVASLLAIMLDRRLFPLGVGYLVAFLYAAWDPDRVYFAVAGGNIVTILVVVAVFRHVYYPHYARQEHTEFGSGT